MDLIKEKASEKGEFTYEENKRNWFWLISHNTIAIQ